MKRFQRLLAAGGAALVATAVAAEPAHAWKPRTHIYLAEQALKDALDDGKVTIYETDYRTGKIIGTLGSFPVDPRVLAALKQYPKQYRAGVLGPDAYPDIVTGQQIVHPNASHPLDQHATAQGTNSWMTYLWDRAYGTKPLTVLGALALQRNDTPAIRAFVTGYMTHAAGDMFAHTFVNHFSGGEFMLSPDPRNALKHLVLEGYIGKRTPALPNAATEDVISIEGVSGFIYREMVWATPGSQLEQKLFQGEGTGKSIPAIFSKLRNELQKDVTKYDNLLSGKEKMSPANNLWLVSQGPKIGFKREWMFDIDKGLKAWPQFSHELGKALVFNEHAGGGADIARAKALTNDYVKNYLVYMGPVPDFVIDGAKLMSEVIDALIPSFPYLKELIAELKKDALNYLVRSSTGRSLDEWSAFVKNPEQNFDPVLNSGGGEHPGRTAARMTLGTFNRDYLKISDPAYSNPSEMFKIEEFPPAFNTVQMCKLLLLGKDGVNQLLTTLAANGTPRPQLPANFENVMLGWLQSLDNDNQWQGLSTKAANPASPLLFAQNGGATYRRMFMRQVGEEEWVTATAPASTTSSPTSAPSSAQIALLDRFVGEWQNVTTGPGFSVTMTFTREGGLLKGTTQVRGQHTENLYPGALVEARASADGTKLEAEWWNPSDVAGYVPKRGTFEAALRPDGDTFAGLYRQPDQSSFVGPGEWTATRKKPAGTAGTAGSTTGTSASGNGATGTGTPTIPAAGSGLGSYTLGVKYPIPITIRSLRYSVEPVNIGDETIAPHANEKLLVVNYTVTNGDNEVHHFDNHNVQMRAVDEDNASHPYAYRVGLERSRREVGTDLDPNGSLDLYTVIVLPAEGEAKKLIIEPSWSGEEKGRATMDIAGKVTPLTAPFADPADGSGASARPVVPADAGKFYPMGFFDTRMDSVAIEDGRLTVIFTIKNRSTLRQSFDNGTFLPTVHDTAGDSIEWDGSIYHATKSAPAGTELEPGAEYRMRFRFTLAEGIAPKTFLLSEHFGGEKTRAYNFDVSTAKSTN